MSDLAKDLLTKYYGLGAEASGRRFLSIPRSIENVKKNEEKQATEETSLYLQEKSDFQAQPEKDITDSETLNTNDTSRRPSRILNGLEDDYDPDEDTSNTDLDLRIKSDLYQYEASAVSDGLSQRSIESQGTEISQVESLNRNDTNVESIESNISDSVSEASSGGVKVSQKSSRISTQLPPLASGKEPICNDTFADFSNTGVDQFPTEILTVFPYIRMLYLSDNNLTELPGEVFLTLKCLEWLDVRNNQISSLPLAIRRHQCLQTILLQGNKIESLPLELCTLPNLNTLQVTQNPLITPPEGVVSSGSSVILEYLRLEWNNAHPDERVEFRKNEIEPKLSTILCYQSPRRNKRRQVPLKNAGNKRIIPARERRMSYKISNRCENKGANVLMENRVLWYSKARDFFAKQASLVQRMKDNEVLKNWRRDSRSYSKAMEKAMKRNEDDIPFGFDSEDYARIFKQRSASKNTHKRKTNRGKFVPPANIDKKISELLESLNKLDITRAEQVTPRRKQRLFKEQIEQIVQYQREIQNLQEYNQVAILP